MTGPQDDLPDGWTVASIRELAAPDRYSLAIGPFGSSLKVSDYRSSGVPLVFVRDIRAESFSNTKTRYISREKAGELSAHYVRARDLLVTKMGDPPGDTAVYPDGFPDAIVTADCIKFTASGGTSSGFLRYWLRTPQGRELVFAEAQGVAQQKVSLERFASIRLPLPPLAEQQRIERKLDALTGCSQRAKEALDALPPLLESLRQSVLAAAFRGDLTADWRAKNLDVEPASELLKRVRGERRRRWEEAELAKMRAKGKAPEDDRWKAKYEEPEAVELEGLPELPSGWCWATIDTMGHLLLGRRRAAEEYVEGHDGRVMRPYLRVANVKEDRLDLSNVLSMPFNDDELALYALRPGDIILSEGQSVELVGQSAVYGGGISDLCIQATVHRFRAFESGTGSAFSQLVFLHQLHSGVFRRAASLTTNIAHLTSERLKPLPFPVPPLAEQAVITERVRGLLRRANAVSVAIESCRKQLVREDRAILAKAFRGELVPQDPNDEPAAVLVERIRAEREAAAAAGNGRAGKKPQAKPARRRSRTTEGEPA